VVREVDEECALRIDVKGSLGEAVQFVHSAKSATCFEKRSTFVVGDVVANTNSIPEHRTLWLEPDEAQKAVTYESHAWAIRRWARLNT
jgi:hypothetical protein